MVMARNLDALLDNYQEFDKGGLQQSFYQDKTVQLIKRPVARYSYAMVRASLNVFMQHNFADHLNSLAFDRDSFFQDVGRYVPEVWPYYLQEAQATLPSARITQLHELEFDDWKPERKRCFGAWHRFAFTEFAVDVLLQVSNQKGRLGAFEGLCFLDNDENSDYDLPADHGNTCQHLGSLHLQVMTDEFLAALGISPESVISAIKYMMR